MIDWKWLKTPLNRFLCLTPFTLENWRHIALLLSVRTSQNLVRFITKDFLNLGSPNLVDKLVIASRRPLLFWGSIGQSSRSQWPWRQKACLTDNWKTLGPTVFKLGIGVGHDLCKNPIDFEVIRSKGKVTVISWKQKSCLTDNWKTLGPKVFKLGMGVGHDQCKNPIDFGVNRSKVKVTVTLKTKSLSDW